MFTRAVLPVLALALAAPQPALAQERPPAECYCRNTQGQRVEMGRTVCLRVDGRSFLARCEMSLNTPMWRETGEDCVLSGLPRPTPGARAQCVQPVAHTTLVHAKV